MSSLRSHRMARPGDPLPALLERYAAERLSPRPDQLTRLRAHAVQAFVEHRLRDEPAAAWTRTRRRPMAWLRRAAVAVAVVFALAGSASLAAAGSGPGQPLYHLRLTVETLTLPAQGSARVEALLAHLDARLAEAQGAGARGDHGAVADAVAAYEETLLALEDAVGQSGSDPFVLTELQRHVTLLEELLGQVPPQAQLGLQRALDHAQQARDQIERRPGTPQGQGASHRPEVPSGTTP